MKTLRPARTGSSKHRRPARPSRQIAHVRVVGELLEKRLVLTSFPAPGIELPQPRDAALVDFYGPDLVGKDGPMAKIGFDLTLLYEELRFHDASDPNSPFTPSNPMLAVAGTQVYVDVNAAGDPASLRSQATAIGMNVQDVSGTLVEGTIPISALNQLAALSTLGFARPVYTPITATGSVTSQADTALQASAARAQFGVTGQGVTVGVLSDSFNQIPYAGNVNGMARDISTGDLPQDTQVLEDSTVGKDEGRAMAQLIHDLAPAAAIRFATAQGGEAHFANNILALANAGSKVIVDDVGYPTEPFFQDGLSARAVNSVFAQGVAYFSAAGNAGDSSYESPFVDSKVTLPNGSKLHDFDPGPGVSTLQRLTIPVGATVRGSLQWDAPFKSLGGAGSPSDIDVSLLGADGTTVIGSTITNNIGGDPLEVFGFVNDGSIDTDANGQPDTTFFLRIELVSGPAPGLMKYVDFGESATIVGFATHSSTDIGHPNTAGAMGVAASAFFLTPAFGAAAPSLNSFSSLGGGSLLFDTSGNRLSTPFNPNSPQIAGVDGTNTTFFGSDIPQDSDALPNFFGTSAAAPHVAAIAALLVEAGQGRLSPSNVYLILENTATDIVSRSDVSNPGVPISIPNGVGVDAFSGHGLVNALQAIQVVKNGIKINNVSQFEGDIGTTDFVFTVSLGTDISSPVTLEYSTVAGTAVALEDYVAQSGTLTFTPGGAKSQLITVQVNGDTKVESDETFIVRLSHAVGGFIGSGDGIGTIKNDDVDLSINDLTVIEGDSGTKNAVFTVTAFGSTERTVTVNWVTVDGTALAGSDYQASAGAVSFAPGGGTANVTVPILGDVFNEPNETFSVVLVSPSGGRLAKGTGVATIIDNDPLPAIFVNDVQITSSGESSQKAVFTVALDRPSGTPVSVHFTTTDGTALAASQYTAQAGTLLFPPGVTTEQIAIDVTTPDVDIPNKAFYLDLSGPTMSSIGDPRGVATFVYSTDPVENFIIDDGDPGFSQTAGWTNLTNLLAYQLDYNYHAPGNGSGAATWTFSDLQAGTYQVFSKWIAFGNRATNAPYTVLDGATPLGTVGVDQTVPPTGDQSNAIVWQSLGSFSISSGTLAVRLSDNANGIVVADAVRIVRGGIGSQAPEMNVSSFDQGIANGESSPTFIDGTDFGPIPAVTNSVTHTFTITNNGNATLHLNGVTVEPEPSANPDSFNIVNQPATSVEPGASTTFTVMFHATAFGVQTAVVSIANDDDSEHPYTFAVQGTGTDPGPAELTIDDSQPGFRAIGNWGTNTNTLAVGSEIRSSAAGQGTNVATWTFPNLAPGSYQVYTSWIPFSNRASNAAFVISDGPTVRSTVTVDQRQTPADQFFDGVGYRSLASVFSSNGTITISLNNQANGFVIADAVHLVRTDLPELPLAPVPTVVASALDVNADGRISAADALLVIQALLKPQGAVASSLALTSSASAGLGGRLDVNGDGRVSVRDALEVISYLVTPHIPAATQLSAPASISVPTATALAAVDQAHSDEDDPIAANALVDSDAEDLASDTATRNSTCTMQVAPAQRSVPTAKKPNCSTTDPGEA